MSFEGLRDLIRGLRFLRRSRRRRRWFPSRGRPGLSPRRWLDQWTRDCVYDALGTWKGAIELLGTHEKSVRTRRSRSEFEASATSQRGSLPSFLEERIGRDLAPWQQGIPADALRAAGDPRVSTQNDSPPRPASLLVEIRNNQPSFRILAPHFFNRFVIAFFLRLAQSYALPSTRFLVDCSDWPAYSGQVEFPVFSFVKTEADRDLLLLPSPDIMGNILMPRFIPEAVAWSNKLRVGFFRGSLTGPLHPDLFNPRLRLLELTHAHPDLFNVGLPNAHPRMLEAVCRESVGSHAAWLDRYATLLERYAKDRIALGEWSRYRYIINIDGNAATHRVANSMKTGSVLIKQESPSMEYWYGGLVGDENFVATEAELGDLVQKLRKLRQDDPWAKSVAEQGARLVQTHLCDESVCSYVVALLESYHRLLK